MRQRLFLLALPTALAAFAFGGVAASGRTNAVPVGKLALMPLPRAAYGPVAIGLPVDGDSGVQTNAEKAESTNDNDTAASFGALGRISGYELGFSDLGSLAKPGRVVFVSTSVDLYTSAAQASATIDDELRDAETDDPGNGFDVISSTRFAAPGLGDGATGIHVAANAGTLKVWLTGVVFQRDGLLAKVSVISTGAGGQNARALALAHAFSTRIDGVLAGKITTPPATVPQTVPGPTNTRSPSVAAAALTSADLDGAKVEHQAYVKEEDAVSSYERSFDDVDFGRSKLTTVETDVSLYDTEENAKIYITGIAAIFNPSSKGFKTFVTQLFAGETGAAQLKSFSVLHKRTFTHGQTKGFEVTLRLNLAIGHTDAGFVFQRSGKLIGTLTAVSIPGTPLQTADFRKLYETFAQRMDAAAR